MIRKCTWLFFVLPIVALSQQASPKLSSQDSDEMVAAVAHDDSVLTGGIGTGHLLAPGSVDVEPIAWLSPSGEWKAIRCDEKHPKECRRFNNEYLKRPHIYKVVSSDGLGATVRVGHMSLDDECFGYGGKGTVSGHSIHYAAVAASSEDIFTAGESARRLTNPQAAEIRTAFAETVGKKLDSSRELRVYAVQLDGQEFSVLQRAFQDYASKPEFAPPNNVQLNFVFAIGKMEHPRFNLMAWKNEVENDENEQILGTVHLKNGHDFLITTISDPETQFFRIYGIQQGKLTMVFSGGGGGC
jgi:hypothetical protein